jgi:aminoglycoside phosphotransferase (APT) family kinase protein
VVGAPLQSPAGLAPREPLCRKLLYESDAGAASWVAMEIPEGLVRRLVADQFPRWASLPVRQVLPGGWDNRTFRLGESLLVRMPSAEGYAAQPEREQRWLPVIGRSLPQPIPRPMGLGQPGSGYPWHWSIHTWLPGETVRAGALIDGVALAEDLAAFLCALRQVPVALDGPRPGPENFFRGGPLAHYDEETRQAIADLGDRVDAEVVTRIWDDALGAEWSEPDVWVHGEMSSNNFLVDERGRLCAVIDFGCLCIGDPAVDLRLTWMLFDGESREAFRAGVELDEGTWARARGWTLWKALITLAWSGDGTDAQWSPSWVISELLAEHQRA